MAGHIPSLSIRGKQSGDYCQHSVDSIYRTNTIHISIYYIIHYTTPGSTLHMGILSTLLCMRAGGHTPFTPP